VLPNPHDTPTSHGESSVRIRVTVAVRLDLRLPERAVALGHRSVLGTSVPEATIDEDRDPRWAKHHIGPPAHSGDDRPMESIPQTEAAKLCPQLKLGSGVTLSSRCHSRERGRRRRRRNT
jgi:hypothetical protein